MKTISIKSDQDTLEELRKININHLKSTEGINFKNVKKFLILSGIILILGLLLTNYNRHFLITTYLSFLIIGAYVLRVIYKRIIIYFKIKKYIKQYNRFKKQYEGISEIYYRLSDNNLEYDGHTKNIYNWNDFTNISEYQDVFTLSTSQKINEIWIPKIVMVNPEEFEFFKSFVKSKIETSHNIAHMP